MPALEYYNVDLEMTFEAEPTILIRELRRKTGLHYSGPTPQGHLVAMDLVGMAHRTDPVKTLKRWIKVLEALKPEARRVFDSARTRVLDVGFGVGEGGTNRWTQIEVPEDVVAGLARLKTSYAITLYPSKPVYPLTRQLEKPYVRRTNARK